jgi:hypothetical protein
MLEGLNELDWNTIKSAKGSAADIPGLIRQLTDEDPIVREETFEWLDRILVFEGSNYEASARSIPFLLELLAEPSVPDKGNLFVLLTGLIPSGGSHWDILEPDNLARWYRYSLRYCDNGIAIVSQFSRSS